MVAWQHRHNPLGIEDGFSRRLTDFRADDLEPLSEFYFLISGIYRYRSPDNQLAFLWDGTDHLEHYLHQWKASFDGFIEDFCRNATFVQAVLDLTVFFTPEANAGLVDARMQHFLLSRFGVRRNKSGELISAKA